MLCSGIESRGSAFPTSSSRRARKSASQRTRRNHKSEDLFPDKKERSARAPHSRSHRREDSPSHTASPPAASSRTSRGRPTRRMATASVAASARAAPRAVAPARLARSATASRALATSRPVRGLGLGVSAGARAGSRRRDSTLPRRRAERDPFRRDSAHRRRSRAPRRDARRAGRALKTRAAPRRRQGFV